MSRRQKPSSAIYDVTLRLEILDVQPLPHQRVFGGPRYSIKVRIDAGPLTPPADVFTLEAPGDVFSTGPIQVIRAGIE